MLTTGRRLTKYRSLFGEPQNCYIMVILTVCPFKCQTYTIKWVPRAQVKKKQPLMRWKIHLFFTCFLMRLTKDRFRILGKMCWKTPPWCQLSLQPLRRDTYLLILHIFCELKVTSGELYLKIWRIRLTKYRFVKASFLHFSHDGLRNLILPS